jgi:hypothetical protein
MKPEAKDLALAILTRIREQGGSCNRTKLLKLLYLSDIEHFRGTRETVTGFNWLFYLYGPWAREYDELLTSLEAEGTISLDAWGKGTVEGESIKVVEPRRLEGVLKGAVECLTVQRYIDRWAASSVPSLLDFVYFETEPMDNAVKGALLDFSAISPEAPILYRRTKSQINRDAVARIRKKMHDRAVALSSAIEKHRHEPVIDDIYVAAINAMSVPDA